MSTLELKQSFQRWQEGLAEVGWNSLYWNNHDQPRVVSRFGDDQLHWRESAKALATVLHLQRGTPFIYQGEELGMTNANFETIEEYRDIESLNHFAEAVGTFGKAPERVLRALRASSRDNARTPMQWSHGRHADFTTAQPWIAVNSNHVRINAEDQRNDHDSVFAYYRALIALRHSEPVVSHGTFRMELSAHPTVFAFSRRLGARHLLVLANLSENWTEYEVPLGWANLELVLANRVDAPLWSVGRLAAWEAQVFRSS